jgi:aspartyl-tRNA(Asn)/glutamyl-tRNA(Gln) amidotransferase subunit C
LKITEQEVRYVAALANLQLKDEEVHRMAKELGDILTHIDKLNELNTDGVEAMAQVLYEAEDTATLRDDVEHEPLGAQTALANAALAGAGHFKIPRVIER